MLVRELRGGNPAATGAIFNALGLGFQSAGDYVRTRE